MKHISGLFVASLFFAFLTSLPSAVAKDEILFVTGQSWASVQDFEAPPASDPGPCAQTVDPKKALLFIDTNSAYREMWGAKKAACKLGVRFEAIPGEDITVRTGIPKELYEIASDKLSFYTTSHKCPSDPKCDATTLQQLTDDAKDKQAQASSIGLANSYYHVTFVPPFLANLQNQNVKVTSLVISGHHYQYGWDGDYLLKQPGGANTVLEDGGWNAPNFIPWVQQYGSVFDQLQTIALWGCGTVIPMKIVEYLGFFPSVTVIGGFSGHGPSSIRESSIEYLQAFLTAASSLADQTNPDTLKKLIEKIPGLSNSYSGVYVNLLKVNAPYEHQWRYWIQEPENAATAYIGDTDDLESKPGPHFEPLSSQRRCESFNRKLPTYISQLQAYENGSAAIPVDTDSSPLGRTYFDMLENEDCYQNSQYHAQYNTARVGLIRFFEEGLKLNFGDFFKADLDQAQAELAALDPSSLRAEFEALKPAISVQQAPTQPVVDPNVGSPDFRSALEAAQRSYDSLKKKIRRRIPRPNSIADLKTAEANYPRLRKHLRHISSEFKALLDQAAQLAPADAPSNPMAVLPPAPPPANASPSAWAASEVSALQSLQSSVKGISLSAWIKSHNRRDILGMIHAFEQAFADPAIQSDVAFAAKTAESQKVTRAMSRLLEQMDPSCTEFLAWHDYQPGHHPGLSCVLP